MSALRTMLEEKYNKALTEPEVFEYQNRLSKFIEILIEIDRKQRKESKQDETKV